METGGIELGYVPTPRQRLFHSTPARYPLYGGAAGGGKSEATMYEHTMLCLEHPGWTALIVRRTFDELLQSQIGRFRSKVPAQLYEWNGTNKIATFNNGGLGVPASTLRFGHVQHEDDVQKYKSDEFASIGFDELTTFTLFQWTFLSTRNRTKVPGTFPKMTGASNPEGIGLEWVKALWIDREPASGMDADQAAAYKQYQHEYVFIPAKLSDNPHMVAADPDYARRLATLPAHLRRALLEGDWTVTPGTYFDIWDDGRHILDVGTEGPKKAGITADSPKWIDIDYGFGHACAVTWKAFVPPRIITYREVVVRRMTPERLGALIGNICRVAKENIEQVILGPDSWSETKDDRTIAVELAEALLKYGLPAPEKADRDRIGGAVLMYQLLESNLWVVTSDCPKTAKAMKTRQRDPDRPEDVLKTEDDLDDVYDCNRYGLKTRVEAPEESVESRIARRITSSDPTIAMAQRMKAEHEIGRSSVLPFRRQRRHF